jgi:hypothetical protein
MKIESALWSTNKKKVFISIGSESFGAGMQQHNQRIYKTKKPRQRTRRPKTGPWSKFNAAILLNIWSAIIPPSFSFDTMDPSLSWGGTFL